MMFRLQFRGWVTAFASLVLLLAIHDSASAQRGRRGLMVYSPADLASLPEVQTELKLTPVQQTKAGEILEQLRTDRRELFQGGGFGDGFEEMASKIQELNQDASAKLQEQLELPQQSRLRQITIQVNGPRALNTPDVAQELKLSEEQQATLAEFPRKTWDAIRDAVDESQSDDERKKIIEDIRAKSDEEMLAILSPEQREEFKALQGEPIEVDTRPLRPRGWRGRDRN